MLNHNIVANFYTKPSLYSTLNRALCQRSTDQFIRMFALLLSKAISDSPHGQRPHLRDSLGQQHSMRLSGTRVVC
jgi:hypothetical protein